jgi:hypothetical protein
VSAIQAFDYSVDLLRALLWQYNKAERLEGVLTQKQAWYDENQKEFWSSWARDVFDLRTANAFGMQVWAVILGVKLLIATEPTDPDQPTWGFSSYQQNFGRGNFGQLEAGAVGLTLEQQRLVLRLRYFQLVSRCTNPEINRFMSVVFADLGHVYVQDHLDMSRITYVFDFSLSSQLAQVLESFDMLPRPATVGVDYIVIGRDTFGFGATNENFENGNFIDHSL